MARTTHGTEILNERNGAVRVKCSDCDFGGRYPSREHVRVIVDNHLIRHHETGAQFCERRNCTACMALRRRAKRDARV